jgi:hypothetical protein
MQGLGSSCMAREHTRWREGEVAVGRFPAARSSLERSARRSGKRARGRPFIQFTFTPRS